MTTLKRTAYVKACVIEGKTWIKVAIREVTSDNVCSRSNVYLYPSLDEALQTMQKNGLLGREPKLNWVVEPPANSIQELKQQAVDSVAEYLYDQLESELNQALKRLE